MTTGAPEADLLPGFIHTLIEEDQPQFGRALERFFHHDGRFVEEGPIRDHFFRTIRRVAARLRSEEARSARLLGTSVPVAIQLAGVLEWLDQQQPRSEDPFRESNLLPELVMLLAQRLRLFREDYLAFVEQLPERGEYRPRYLNLGPSGLCNLRCRDCILWGALFQNPVADGVPRQELLTHLADAEELGTHGLSFCIGEPTVNLRDLGAALDRVRVSPTLRARSFITNGRFARTRKGAERIWRQILEHLGPEKAADCAFAVSANPHLVEQGVLTAHTVNAIEAFRAVMPNPVLIVQLIRDEGYKHTQEELLGTLVSRGLLEPEKLGHIRGVLRSVKLRDGLELLFSIMAKMPAINSPEGESDYDPYVFYIDQDEMQGRPFPGLFMRTNSDPLEDDSPEDSERIALGPDGWFYADYHFMVRQVRPLGRRLAEALSSFRKDPLLMRLVRVDGLKELIAAYDRMPPDERPQPNLIEQLNHYATVSMAAANLIFGDEDLALRLARFLVREAEGSGSEARAFA